MNAALTVLVSVASAAAVVAGAGLLREDRPRQDGGSIELAAVVSDLKQRLAGLESDQARTADELARLSVQAPAGSERSAVGDGELEERIEAYIAARPVAVEASAPAIAASRGSMETLDLRSIMDLLTDENVAWLEREEVWQRLRAGGRLDEVLAEFQRLAEADPRNPDRQVQLGYAYLQKIQEVGASTLAGKYATLADETFDRALALDETHWEARYMKAISLSHWPAFTGKTATAIAELEKLASIQESVPLAAHHAETYLALGNLYLGQGKNELALAAWQKGLAYFPGHAELSGQIATLQK